MKTLNLTLKKKWFDMILQGEKQEEYREIKPYWEQRLCREFDCTTKRAVIIAGRDSFIKYDTITFKNGYAKDCPIMELELKGIEVGMTKSNWCDDGEVEVFVLKLGRIIFFKNCG